MKVDIVLASSYHLKRKNNNPVMIMNPTLNHNFGPDCDKNVKMTEITEETLPNQ